MVSILTRCLNNLDDFDWTSDYAAVQRRYDRSETVVSPRCCHIERMYLGCCRTSEVSAEPEVMASVVDCRLGSVATAGRLTAGISVTTVGRKEGMPPEVG